MKIERRLPTVVISLLAIFSIHGCGGSGGGSAPPPPPVADTTVPTVSAVQAPASTVNRIVTLTLTATDNVGVTTVRFFVDGNLLGADTAAPYSIDWDTSGAAEGDHSLTAEAEDAVGNIATSAAATVAVRNMMQFDVAPSGQEEVPFSDTLATAQASLTFNLVTGDVTGALTTNGITATAAHIHDAYAGMNGGVLVPLAQDGGDPTIFTVPDGSSVDAAGIDRLLAGALYINVHSAAAPGGEIRGQILPDGFLVRFADLTGDAAVPPVDSVASGRAAITLDELSGAVAVHAQVSDLDNATQAHVHQAFAGDAGAVLVALAQDPMDAGHWFVEDQTLNAAGLDAFASGELYVNIHSPANPSGEIRGQLLPEGITVVVARLSGVQEVPAVNSSASGLAALTLDEANALLTAHVNTSGLGDASGSHLHNAFGGRNGPIEIGLIQDGSDPAHWFAEEQALDAAQLAAILAGGTYINVHSPTNPGGEIRGQIAPPPVEVLFSDLSGDQEVPAVDSAARGIAASTVNRDTGTVTLHLNATGASDASASHIHTGAAGQNGPVLIALVQDMADSGHWSVVGAQLDNAGRASYEGGDLYVNLHTPANPGGEIRGQLVESNAAVVDTEDPMISLTSPGATVSDTVSLAADASDDRGVVEVRFLVDGALIGTDATEPYSVDWDTTAVANGQVTLTAEADDEAGNTGSSADVVVTVQNVVVVTLSELQMDIFTPTCSAGGCHTGPTSNTLPTGMNLTSTANSFAALVNVASRQVGTLNRVTPGDPDNSYLIQKLEGTAAGGVRMPWGGPFLDQATIDKVRQWIADGALNN